MKLGRSSCIPHRSRGRIPGMVFSCSSLNLGLGFSLLEKGGANSVVPEVLGQLPWIQLLLLGELGLCPPLLLHPPPALFPSASFPKCHSQRGEAGYGFGVPDRGSFPTFLVSPRTKSLRSPRWACWAARAEAELRRSPVLVTFQGDPGGRSIGICGQAGSGGSSSVIHRSEKRSPGRLSCHQSF